MCMLNGRDGMDVVSNVGATFIAVPLCVLVCFSFFSFAFLCFVHAEFSILSSTLYGDVKLTMTVLELAGSRFASWISCLFLCSESDNGGQQRQVEGKSQYLYMHLSIPRQITNGYRRQAGARYDDKYSTGARFSYAVGFVRL